MIVDIIVNMFVAAFLNLVRVLPNAPADPGVIASAWNWLATIFAGLLYAIGGIDGLDTHLKWMISFAIVFSIAMFVWDGIKMVYNAVRGSGV